MSDPNRRSGFEPVPEPEDMSLFLHNLLQSSPAVATGAGGNSAVMDYRNSGGSLNFSDPGCFFESEEKDRAEKAFCSASNGDCDAVTSSSKREEFTGTNKGFQAMEATRNGVNSSSSKRSRSAEVHNMSEKKRRSRINEKLKALQNLIPNSNKTDKASMLDEAIEYLKQLQLQVQMLTLRNGFSLHPNYVPGCLPSMQLPFDLDAGNVLPSNNRGAETFSGNQAVLMQTISATHSHNPKFPGHHVAVTNNGQGTSFAAESSFQSHFALLNHLASAKDLCREDTLSHLPLDASCSGNNSSSGMSS